MNEKADMIGVITVMLQRANYREVRRVCVFLRAMLGEEETRA